MVSGKKKMNPVTITIISTQEKNWYSHRSNCHHPVLKFCKLPNELYGSTHLIDVITHEQSCKMLYLFQVFAPSSIDWWHIAFALFVCLSVCQTKTLTLTKTFEWQVMKFSYFTSVFLVVKFFSLLLKSRSSVKVIVKYQGYISRKWLL